MQILEIKGKKWVIGLEWEILPGDGSINEEAKEIAQKTNNKFGVLLDFDNTYAIGLTNKIDKNPLAAVCVAEANKAGMDSNREYPDWVVLEEVGEDRYWMCVIKSGIPAPQYDAVFSLTEIKEKITELLINDTFKLFTNSNELVSVFEGIKEVNRMGLNELTEGFNPKIQYRKYLGIPNWVYITGGSLLLLAGGLYLASEMIEGASLKEKAQFLEKQAKEEERLKNERYRLAVEKFETDKKNALDESVNRIVAGLSGNPSKILEAFYNNIGQTPIGTHGWKLVNIECYFDLVKPQDIAIKGANRQKSKIPEELKSQNFPRLSCDYMYKREGLNTARMFLQDYPNAKLNGDYAVVNQKVEIDPIYIARASDSILQELPNARKFGFDLQSQLQLLKIANIDHEITSSSELTYTIPGEPIKPTKTDTNIRLSPTKVTSLGYAMGEINVKGGGLDFIKELADNVDFTGTGLRSVAFDVSSGGATINWVAKFNYYIKADGGFVGASTTEVKTTTTGEKK